jgi:nucleoside-diphosphate-sugar epimerase
LFSFSTTRVYGLNSQGVISEESPTNPDSVYAEGHLSQETVLLESNWSILRLSNLFGRPGTHGRLSRTLLTNFVLAGFVAGEKTTLRGPSQTKKDFLPISALLGVLESLAFSDMSVLLNVTSGQSRTLANWVNYLADAYENATQFKPIFEFESDFPTSPDVRLSNSRLKGLLPGWEPDFDNEVNSLLTYMRQAHGST